MADAQHTIDSSTQDPTQVALLAQYATAVERRDAARANLHEAHSTMISAHTNGGTGPDFVDAAREYVVADAAYEESKQGFKAAKKALKLYRSNS